MYNSTVELDDETQEYFIVLPQEVVDALGIYEGDILEMELTDNGFTLRKKSS